MLGHRRRSVRALEGNDRRLDVITAGGDALAAAAFQKLAFDPFADHGDLSVGELVAFGRHLRVLGLEDALEQKAAGGVAGIQHFAILAALECALEGGEV